MRVHALVDGHPDRCRVAVEADRPGTSAQVGEAGESRWEPTPLGAH
jgi:hypothetical protein